jgi:hypothetical protein
MNGLCDESYKTHFCYIIFLNSYELTTVRTLFGKLEGIHSLYDTIFFFMIVSCCDDKKKKEKTNHHKIGYKIKLKEGKLFKNT